jgi:YfiR/HmsC-like
LPPLRPTSRRALLGTALACGSGLWLKPAGAQSLEVPVRLQAALLARAVEYDRNFATRAGARVVVFIAVRPGDADSERAGEQIRLELGALAQIGGLPHTEEVVLYRSVQKLSERIVQRAPAILYLSAGLADDVPTIARALEGVSILSVGVSATYVPRRAVLGFDAESGRPQLVVHLAQARRQRVAFRSEFLNLARVIQ